MPTETLTKTRFRLQIDVPQTFCVEPGFVRYQHCSDFRPDTDSLQGCVQEPLTRTIMLKPSFLSTSWYDSANWEPFSNWRIPVGAADYWSQIYRGGGVDTQDLARFWTTLSQEGVSGGGTLPALVDIAIAAVSLTSALTSDVLVWAMESNFTLSADEGFVWHYRTLADDHSRPRNWFALQWSDLYLHFSADGMMTVYRLNDAGTAIDPTPFDQHRVCYPGDLMNKDGYLAFLPIPGYGLAVYQSRPPQESSGKGSSGFFGTVQSHLIRLPNKGNNATGLNITTASKIRLALASNLTRMHNIFGFHRIRYETTGTHYYWDNTFAPGYLPLVNPALLLPYVAQSKAKIDGLVNATASLWKPDKSGGYVAGDNAGAARIRVTLSSSNTKYSPFLSATEVAWTPTFAERDTTPIEPRLWGLEFSQDEMGRFEGSATIMAEKETERLVLERGDTTFELSTTTNGGTTWTTLAGGLARVDGDVRAVITLAGMHYEANVTLYDMFARFGEIGQLNVHAFDGQTIVDAIKRVLLTCGLPGLESEPAELAAIRLPDKDTIETFKFAPKSGTRGDDLIRDFLLFARREHVEWRIRYKWTTNLFVLEKRPYDVSNITNPAWKFTPYPDEIPNGRVSVTAKKILVGEADGITPWRFAIVPPEANIIQPFGLSDTNPNTSKRIVGIPAYNVASITDKTSVDYLGRIVTAYPQLAGITEPDQLRWMTRRLFDAACYRRVLSTTTGRDFVAELHPRDGIRADLIGPVAPDAEDPPISGRVAVFAGQWLKKRSVAIDYRSGEEETMTVVYHADSRWESEVA